MTAPPKPSWEPLQSLELRLAAGVHTWSDADIAYLEDLSLSLGLSRSLVTSALDSEEGRRGLVVASRKSIHEGSLQLMDAMILSQEADARDAIAAFESIANGPIDFYARIAENEIRRLKNRQR